MAKLPPRKSAGLPNDLKAFEVASLLQQTQAFFATGQFGKAGRAAQDVLKRDADNSTALLILGKIAQKTGANDVAVKLFSRILARDDRNAAAQAGLGDTQTANRDWAAAAASYKRAVSLSPKDPNLHTSLGAALIALGRREEATASFQRAKTLDPSHRLASYMLGGLDGHTEAVQADYVKAIFDGYASYFEKHLTETLHYRIPWIIADAVVAEHATPFSAVLDLGCGTGLIGDALSREQAPVIDGVDLSPKMVAITRGKGRYREVYEGDIVQTMAKPEVGGAGYDLIAAADVFIYVGALEAVFAKVQEILQPEGLFAFSLEHSDEDGFAIQASSRYAHGARYTADLAQRSGFAPVLNKLVPLRQESGRDIPGRVEIWRKA